ncbi:MAG TPA: hypothetical protein PLW65_04530 [Pseudomonadota bacterium]|nr:hypothetical protein [Pseudomonadota bacterium]
MRFLLIALCAALTLSAGCDSDPCASKETRAAFVGLGGPLGVAAVLALSCPQPEPEQPIAAVPQAGLVEQPDMAQPADMAKPAPDLASAPDLSPLDTDHDGIPDATDKCPALAAGGPSDPARLGCPAPFYVDFSNNILSAESGSWSLWNNVWTSAPVYDWTLFRPVASTLVMRIDVERYNPSADRAVVEFSWSGTVDMGQPTTQIECLPLKNQGLYDFPANPSDPTVHTCEQRTLQALFYDERGNPLSGGAECAPLPGRRAVNCVMQFGTLTPLPSDASYFFVKFKATGTVSISNVKAIGKIKVTAR